jgi:alpha-tubulin suppressor-like RCC1 family protein
MARETLKNCLMTIGPLLFLVFPLSAWTGDKNGGEQSTPSGVELRHKYIATGDNHSLAVTCDGRVYAWGNNNNCEVGPTDFNDAEDLAVQIPLPVEELKPGAVEVIGGGYHSMALMSDGTVYAWGANVEGQLGVHSKDDSCIPLQVHGPGDVGYLTGITRLAAGHEHSLAVKEDGSLWAWGRNWYGQLGIHSNDDHTIPYQVHGPGDVGYLTDVVDVAAGHNHSLALKSDGTVYAWGYGGHGQLGIHSNNDHTIPYQVHGPGNVGYLTGIIKVAAGVNFSLALKNDGTMWAWGEGGSGQLGIHSNNDHTIPYQVHGVDNVGYLTDVVDIAGGQHHTLAVKSDGTVYAWGANGDGQLGIHNKDDHTVPYQVHGPDDVGYLTGIVEVDAGQYFSLALREDGTVWAWGQNVTGQLGIHSYDNHTIPYQTHGPDDVGYLTGIGPICNTPPPGTPTPGGAHVTICHRPGTPHEKTLHVPWRALDGHANHGDRLGACSP